MNLKDKCYEVFHHGRVHPLEGCQGKGIDNTPSPEIEAHITESVESLLDPLREAWEACSRKQGWGTPAIRISSGYRCRELNRAVGGSVTSAHRYGYAFDLIPLNGRMREFKRSAGSF